MQLRQDSGLADIGLFEAPWTVCRTVRIEADLTSENGGPGEALVSNVGAHVGNANAEAVAEGNQARKISLPSRGECRNSDQRGEQQHRGDSRDGSNVRHVSSPLSP